MDKGPLTHDPASCMLILSIPLCACLAPCHGWIQNWLFSVDSGADLRERKLVEAKSSRVQICHMTINGEKKRTFRKLSIIAFDTRKHRHHEIKNVSLLSESWDFPDVQSVWSPGAQKIELLLNDDSNYNKNMN